MSQSLQNDDKCQKTKGSQSEAASAHVFNPSNAEFARNFAKKFERIRPAGRTRPREEAKAKTVWQTRKKEREKKRNHIS